MPEYLIIFLAGLGILNAGYLYWQGVLYQKRGRPMTCPVGGHCQDVVFSKYGKTSGVKNEIWGILYYVAVILAVFLALKPVLLGISILSALFTTYLIFVQFFILKNFCSWCLLASGINYLIFIFALLYFF